MAMMTRQRLKVAMELPLTMKLASTLKRYLPAPSRKGRHKQSVQRWKKVGYD